VTQQTETALTVHEEQLPSLLVGSTAKQRVQQAKEIATELADVIEKRHLFVQLGKRRHVLYEGWTTLGALMGVFPVTVWARPIPNGYEARVEAKTLGGVTVGAAEAECTRDEPDWDERPKYEWQNGKRVKVGMEHVADYALRSMAQTRAGAKALRMPLGFIMQLSGFDATPAEEMRKERPPKGGQPVIPNQAALAGYMTEHELKARDVLRLLGLDLADEDDAKAVWGDYVKDLVNQGLTENEAYGQILKDLMAA